MLNVEILKRYEYKGKYVKLKLKNGKVVDEHRYIYTNYLQRELKYNEVIHHINGDKTDNRIENLELKSRQKHAKEHQCVGRTMINMTCNFCGKSFKKELTSVNHKKKKGQQNFYCSRSCQVKQQWNERKGIA